MRISINGTDKIVDLAGNDILDKSLILKLAPFEYISPSNRQYRIICIYI